MVAGIQAMRDSGLEVTEANATRIGVSIGSGIGGIGAIEDGALLIEHRGPRRMPPFFVPGAIITMIAGNLSIMYGMRGPNIAMPTGCTARARRLGFAARHISPGDGDRGV